ncbi:terminase small subunit [Chloroflexota bacterium]
MATYLADPKLFGLRRRKWWWFCLYYTTAITKIGNATEAARRAGYSPRSARFIASRLWRKPVIRDVFRRMRDRVNATRKLSEGAWLIPDYSGRYHIYRNKKI